MPEKKIYVKDNLRKIVQGEQLILSVGVEHNSFVNPVGDNSLHYLWTKDGIPFGDQEGDLSYHDFSNPREFWDKPTITLDNIKVEDSGIYQCEISNQFGKVLSTATTVEVLDALNSPLFTKNLVQNGEQRLGDTGWSVIEGSMEMTKPGFYDKFKRSGFASVDHMTPSSGQIIDELIYPRPQDGDRLMGPFKNRSKENQITLHQEIDLLSIADVVDRKVEGITSVDLRVGAWMIGNRFHTVWDRGLLELKENGTVNYARATIAGDQIGQNLNIYFHLRNLFFEDSLTIKYILLDEHENEIRRIHLQNVPNSYMKNIIPFKSRRIDLPVGTRKIRIEISAQRDGKRPEDLFMDGAHLKQIRVGCWGINARIYVNGIGDNFNTSYKHWHMPKPWQINPATLNYKWQDKIDFKNWWENNCEGRGSYGNKGSYTLASWMGIPSWKQYRNDGGDTWTNNRDPHGSNRVDVMFFNIWRNIPDDVDIFDNEWGNNFYDESSYDWQYDGLERVKKTWHEGHGSNKYDRWFGIPCSITDAALGDLNIKRMQLTWFKDYNLNRIDENGKSVIHFTFGVPEIPADQEDLNTSLRKRRKLVLPASHTEPLIHQDLYMEDIDQSIFQIHVNRETSNFRPDLNITEIKNGAWTFEDDEYYYLENFLYDPFRWVCDVGLPGTDYPNWLTLIDIPRQSDELEAFYWGLVLVYWKLLGIEIEENVDLGGHDTDDDLAEQIQYTMRIDDIYNDVQQRSGIPFEHFNVHQDQIKVWIKKRCTNHLLDCAFRSLVRRLRHAKGGEGYKEAIKVGTKVEMIESSANEWGDPWDA